MNLALRVDPAWTIALFVGLAAAFVAVEGRDRAGSVARRAAVGVAISIALALGLEAALAWRTFHPWNNAPYLPALLPAALGAAAAVVLFPGELRRLRARLATSARARAAGAVALVIATAILLVSAADLSVLAHARFVSAPWKTIPLAPGAYTFNILLLSLVALFVLAVTGRALTTVVIVVPAWLAFTAATLVKLTFMQTAIQPLDLLRVPELLPLLPRMFGTPWLAAIVLGALGWAGGVAVLYVRERPALSPRSRLAGALSLAVGMAAVPAVFAAAERSPRIGKWLVSVGAPQGQFKEQAKRNGILLSFASELPSLALTRPPGYSPALAAAAAARYAAGAPRPAVRPVNLIVYLVESFMDPGDLGIGFTAEPIPTIRALQRDFPSGHAIVPGEFGGSANTEFELLTGMSMAFLPAGSTPYRQYVHREFPSLPRQLARLGYTTIAVQPDPRFYFDRERAYRVLGFDRVMWLDDVPGIERDGRVGWPSDRMVVRSVIEASRSDRPFFIFAFPASTHSYYRSGMFRASRLAPVRTFPGDSAGEVKEYVNALRVADREIGALVEHFAARPEPTVIAILGDHLPPLSSGALAGFYEALAGTPAEERELRIRRVPLVVWANFPLAREHLELGTSALPAYLLSVLGAGGTGVLAVVDSLRREMPALTRGAGLVDGRVRSLDSLPARVRVMLEDYRLLQYDLLVGRQHSLGGGR